ncbi:MAG: ATP synthase F1 subunit gamma [Pseudomonadota bacterium]
MASLQAIRNRIRSVASTQKITRAMKMVAAARFRRAHKAVIDSRAYASKLEDLLEALCGFVGELNHPYVSEPAGAKRALVVMASDRGLCGSFNANILRRLDAELKESGPGARVVPLGKKAVRYAIKRKLPVLVQPEAFWTGFRFEKASVLASDLAGYFVTGEVDRVDLLYNEFTSLIAQKPKVVTILPIRVPAAEGAAKTKFVAEPSVEIVAKELLERVVRARLFSACLNSQASEFGARMTAMDSATRNAEEMIDLLTLTMNRARQTAITKELMEIVGGAEALK